MQVDFPALERPTKAISGTSSLGRCFSSGAVVNNLAVCSQPIAIFASGLGSFAAGVADTATDLGFGVAEEEGLDTVMVGVLAWHFPNIGEKP